MTNIDEGSIQARHQTLDATQENISYWEIFVGFLIMEFYQLTFL